MARLKMAKKKKTGYAKKPSSDFHLGFVAHCSEGYSYKGARPVDGTKKKFDPRNYPANDPIETKKK